VLYGDHGRCKYHRFADARGKASSVRQATALLPKHTRIDRVLPLETYVLGVFKGAIEEIPSDIDPMKSNVSIRLAALAALVVSCSTTPGSSPTKPNASGGYDAGAKKQIGEPCYCSNFSAAAGSCSGFEIECDFEQNLVCEYPAKSVGEGVCAAMQDGANDAGADARSVPMLRPRATCGPDSSKYPCGTTTCDLRTSACEYQKGCVSDGYESIGIVECQSDLDCAASSRCGIQAQYRDAGNTLCISMGPSTPTGTSAAPHAQLGKDYKGIYYAICSKECGCNPGETCDLLQGSLSAKKGLGVCVAD
jgi:hypothetical protein